MADARCLVWWDRLAMLWTGIICLAAGLMLALSARGFNR
jgi:hypothetical protein